MTDDFSPIEYSWKWGSGDEKPEIRVSTELIGPYAGTVVDPYNQAATMELLIQMSSAIPSVDITWFHKYVDTFQHRETDEAVDFYMRTPSTSFDHIAVIMSLGGRRKMNPEALAELKELWRATLGLHENFSSSAELPKDLHCTSGVLFYFDIKPGCSTPDVKVYIPVRHYGKNDGSIASGLTIFLQERGRGRFLKQYMSMLRGFAEQQVLDSRTGLYTYISVGFQEEDG